MLFDEGKLPQIDFSDPDDPLNILKFVLIHATIDTQAETVFALDEVTGLIDDLILGLDPQLNEMITVKYEQYLLEDISKLANFYIYDKETEVNQTITEFYEEMLDVTTIDLFRSANPAYNLVATQILTRDVINQNIKNHRNPESILNKAEYVIKYDNSVSGNELLDSYTDGQLDSALQYSDFYGKVTPISDNEGNSDYIMNNTIYDFVNPFFVPVITDYIKTSTNPEYMVGSVIENKYRRLIHNNFGDEYVNDVYPGLAMMNGIRFVSEIRQRYRDFNLISPNRGWWGSFRNSFSLSFDMDFFDFGVRNSYGELPVITNFLLNFVSNSKYYYNSHSSYLIGYTYQKLINY